MNKPINSEESAIRAELNAHNNAARSKAVKNSLPAVALLLDSARGTYIPRDFVQTFDLTKWKGIFTSDVGFCSNPDDEWYWESWERVLNNAEFHENGNVWRLYQDGNLWAICYELMSDEEKRNFGFDVDE